MRNIYRSVTARFDRVVDLPLLILRSVVGLLFIDHGLQTYHVKGGLTSFAFFLRSMKHVPAPGLTSHVVPFLEVAGGVLLIAGLLTRVWALLLAGEMVFTGFVVKLIDLSTGVVNQRAAGAEVDFLYLVAMVAVLLLGPGRASLDALFGLEVRSEPAGPTRPPRRIIGANENGHAVAATSVGRP